MASQKEEQKYLVQSVTFEGEELDLSMANDISFIECYDLSGPQMIMSFHDRNSYIRDEIGIKEGSELEATLDDPYNDDAYEPKSHQFRVLSMPVVNSVLKVNCIQMDLYKGKMRCPVGKSVRWEKDKDSIATIFEHIFGVSASGGEEMIKRDYTLVEGNIPSSLFRKIIREHGLLAYYDRGEFKLKTMADFANSGKALEYAFDDNSKENQIKDYKKLYADGILKTVAETHYQSFDPVKGFVKSEIKKSKNDDFNELGDDADLPTKVIASSDPAILDNLTDINKTPIPMLDLVMLGGGTLKPGVQLDITWNLWLKDRPIDESLPASVVCGSVAHWYASQRYFCRVRALRIPGK